MAHTVEALWKGELAFIEHCGAHDAQANRLLGLMTNSRDSLWEGLTEAQRALFQTDIDRSENYTGRMMELAFCDGFSVGVQLLTEGLCER